MNKVVDLFAGCGGLTLGFQNEGFEIIGAYEYWQVAADCYEQNFKHPLFRMDLSDINNAITHIKSLKPDIIIGGPPCQDFSHAGKRIEDKRAGLTEAYAKIVTTILPRWFVMENVDRSQKSIAYATARSLFKKFGYGLTEVTLDASLCGVPQKRKRFFCIGSLEENDDFLLQYIQSSLSKKAMSLRDFFGSSLDLEYYYRHPRNYNRRAIFSIDEPAPTMRGMNRPVPPGYPGHPNDAKPLDDTIRALTTLERALIQTFPPDFKWIGNKTDMEQMIGNAVPVKLAEFVARALNYYINLCPQHKQNIVDLNEFKSWLQDNYTLSANAQRDTISRLKRANAICEIPDNLTPYYFYQLEQSSDFSKLIPAVRSQLKRAVTLYSEYCNS